MNITPTPSPVHVSADRIVWNTDRCVLSEPPQTKSTLLPAWAHSISRLYERALRLSALGQSELCAALFGTEHRRGFLDRVHLSVQSENPGAALRIRHLPEPKQTELAYFAINDYGSIYAWPLYLALGSAAASLPPPQWPINQSTSEGWTLLHVALSTDCGELVEQLIKHGADPLQRDRAGGNAFHWVALSKPNALAQKTVKLLVQHGLHIDSPDPNGVTPLSIAVTNVAVDVVRALIDNGADPDRPDDKGRTPRSCLANLHSMFATSSDDVRAIENVFVARGLQQSMAAAPAANARQRL